MLQYSKPNIVEADIAAAAECLFRGTLDPGLCVKEFRIRLAKLVGVPVDWVLLTGSCTQALRAAAAWLVNQTVIGHVAAPVLTWPGSYCWTPPNWSLEFCDTDINGFLNNTDAVSRASFAVAVELWGRAFPVKYLETWRGAPVVLDAAQRFAAPEHSQWLRSGLVSAVCYSFGPVKEVTTIRGGALVAPWAKEMETWIYSGTQNKVGTQQRGDNARMTEVGAALGLGQLRRHAKMKKRRQKILSAYADELPGGMLLTRPGKCSGHLAVVRFKGFIERAEAQTQLSAAGYNTTVHYPLPGYVGGCAFPNASALSGSVLTLPCHSSMAPKDARRIAKIVRRCN